MDAVPLFAGGDGGGDEGVVSRSRATMPGVSSGELARELKVSDESIRNWSKVGTIPVLAEIRAVSGNKVKVFRRYDVEACRAAMLAHRGAVFASGKGGRRPGAGAKNRKGIGRHKLGVFVTETADEAEKAEKAGAIGFSKGDVRDAKPPAPVPVDPNTPSALKAAAETRKANATALKTELEIAKTQGRLVSVDDVVSAHAKLYSSVVGRLDVVPAAAGDRLMAELGITDPDMRPVIEAVVSELIMQAREDLAANPLGASVAEAVAA